MNNIRIEHVSDVNFTFPYLEVFFKNDVTPFLEIGISENKELAFKFYPLEREVVLDMSDWRSITTRAIEFLPQAIKNENDFRNFIQ
jgi:hypothetical protein